MSSPSKKQNEGKKVIIVTVSPHQARKGD